MKTSILLTALLVPALLFTAHAANAAETSCKHDISTAQSALSRIYAGERALHTEKAHYSADFADIGFDPNIVLEDEECDLANWSFEITSATPETFTATAYSRVNGMEFVINEKKDIAKKDIKVSSTPMAD